MKIYFTLVMFIVSFTAISQTMKVLGKTLLDVNGNPKILCGINYQILDNGINDFNNPVFGLKSTGGCGASPLPTINEMVKMEQIVLITNPSNGMIEINPEYKIKNIEVFDLSSSKIYVSKISDHQYNIFTANGVYILNAELEGGKYISEKLLIY